MMLMRAFGQKLRQLRHAAGLTPDSLAHKSQVSPARISSAENGRKEPSLSLILKLCDGLELTPNELIGDLPIAQQRRRR
jgi:transcriptional regulator with XRE-family HTH domain